jgi:flagellar export protein FliJ
VNRSRTRLARLVELARLREELARRGVATARTAEQAARSRLDASQAALRAVDQDRHHGTGGAVALRFAATLRQLGRDDLRLAEDDARRAGDTVEAELGTWHVRHRQLGSLERLDDRHQELARTARRRHEQRQVDELAATRAGGRP